MRYRIVFLLFFMVFVTSVAHGTGVMPPGQPEYEFIYDRMEREEALTRDLYDFQLGPYELDTARFSFGPFSDFATTTDTRVAVFGFASEDFAARRQVSPRGYESLRAGGLGQPHPNVFVYGSFVLDEALADDPDYYGKQWRGLAGDVEDAFVHVSLGNLRATAGRFSSFWGIRNSMLLASHSHLDGFGYTYRWGRVAISYRLARLDGLSPERDSVAQFENRFFAAHRFDFHFSPQIRLGVFEAVIFGGPGRQIDLFYLNPFIFFHGSQLNEGSNDNTLAGLDFTAKPWNGLKLYGQLMIDDFQIEKSSQGDQEPDQYAVVAGLYAVNVFPQVDVRAEYSRVTNWTFNQVLERNRYLYNGKPLGAADGNDYDRMQVSAIRWLNEAFAVRVTTAYRRQGEGRITDDWTSPWLEVNGDYGEPFPTGTVEKRFSFSAGCEGFLRDFLYIDLEAGADLVRNAAHVSGDDRTLPFFRVRLSAFLNSMLQLD